jgi:Flp pilus assembly protein CpaB
VAGSIVLLFSVGARGSRTAFDHLVAAKRTLPIGTRLQANDLTVTRVRVGDDGLRRRLFTRIDALVGAFTVAPIASGELIQESSVVDAGAPRLRQVSVPIDAARAFGDALRPGELVDVLATFGAGADAFTVGVVTGATVLSREAGTGALSDGKREVVVLGVATADDAAAVAHAAAAGQISLVRVTGAPSAGASGAYRPSRPER